MLRPRVLQSLFVLTFGSALQAEEMDADTLAVLRVQPLLKERCFGCHGGDPDKIKAGYDMTSMEGMMKGGDSEEAALVPGSAATSPLFLSSQRDHDFWEAMPPKDNDALDDKQLAWLERWINEGAPWPEGEAKDRILANSEKWLKADGIIVETEGALSSDWANRRYKPEDLWAYQPVVKPEVESAGHPVDTLLAQHLPEGLDLAAAADARTFIRRATFDLLGLPPSPEEIASFTIAYEKDPDVAVERLIERLLESPHYGERMARHWLDVTRYADSAGLANDFDLGNAWRYRDYVIRAFNDDKPFDQFIREQIAGDEINAEDPEMLVATGFLRTGPWELTGMEVAKVARQRFLDDVTNSVGETFLAHSLQCARCHDHKFDPVPTHDYYAIQAVFGTTQLGMRNAPFLEEENTRGFEEVKYLKMREQEYIETQLAVDQTQFDAVDAWYAERGLDPRVFHQAHAKIRKNSKEDVRLFAKVLAALKAQDVPADQIPPRTLGKTGTEFGRETVASKGIGRLKWEYDRYRPLAFSVYNGKTPPIKSITTPFHMPDKPMAQGELEQTAILAGGDPFAPTDEVEPGVLSAITTLVDGFSVQIPTAPSGRRSALADWISDPRNPLTTRTIVNRIWLWHFGQPLAGNPNNFGSTGKKPTHPELLDWLAATFVEDGWSFKKMHRRIMTSEAYRRSGLHPDADGLAEKDPHGVSYAVFQPRRLTAEEFRDASLVVSGELNPEMGGIPVRPEMNQEVALQPRQVMGAFAASWVPNPQPDQRHRRSIYVQKVRGLRDPFMEVFNEPGPDFSCEVRDASTVTPQVFSLFNSQSSANRSLALAHRVIQEAPKADREAQLRRLFQLTLGRAPEASEIKACLSHWQECEAHHKTTKPVATEYPIQVKREARAEKTGEKYFFMESLFVYEDFVPDLQPTDVDAATRGLAEVCLVLLNSNEFAYVY